MERLAVALLRLDFTHPIWGESDCQSTENTLHLKFDATRYLVDTTGKALRIIGAAVLTILVQIPRESNANQSDLVTCKSPSGWAYYHSGGLVPRDVEGWRKDEINPGSFRLRKLKDGEFDIEVVDAVRTFSLRDDGGDVMLLRSSSRDATFLHFVKGKVIEIYTFWVAADGKSRFDLIQSKGGGTSPIHKSALMVGECSPIRFDQIK